MKKSLVLIVAFTIALGSSAQNHRFAVFFTDKAGEGYPYSIDNPEAFLSERAIERRNKQSIPIDETDLPVSPTYVNELVSNDITVYFTSKWMNAALVQVDSATLSTIVEFDFVDSVALMAEGERLSTTQLAVEIPEEFEDLKAVRATTDLQLVMLQADVMHANEVRGEGMLIAVLDNGFRGVDKYNPFQHLWENEQIVATRDFVENSGNVFRLGGHGTSVFSTIAGRYQTDFYGTAYNADFVLCITEEGGSEDRIEEFNLLLGAEFADSLGADVVNASLGYKHFDIPEHNYTFDDLNGNTAISSRATKMAVDKGMVVVVSAGNDGDNPEGQWRYISPPSDPANVLAVGSVNPDFTWTLFSSLGPTSDGRVKPDVSAMGLGTAVVTGNGVIERSNGTSFAAPQVAGLAAGIWQTNPEWTNIQVMDAIRNSGHKAHAPDTLIGHGVPFYSYAVDGKALNVSDILNDKIVVYPNPFQGSRLFIRFEESLSSTIKLKMVDEQGKQMLKRSIKSPDSGESFEFEVNDLKEGLYFLSLQYDDQIKVVKLINF